MLDSDKYVVFNREDFFQVIGDVMSHELSGEDLRQRVKEVEISDAVVIRQQDVFAPPALDAYANGINVALSLTGPGPVASHLRTLADYFHSKAAQSWQMTRKIPD